MIYYTAHICDLYVLWENLCATWKPMGDLLYKFSNGSLSNLMYLQCRSWMSVHKISAILRVKVSRGISIKDVFFFSAQQPKSGPRLTFLYHTQLHTHTHTHTHTHRVRLPWASDPSSQRPLQTQDTTNTNPQRDSNPRSQPSTGCKPTPCTSRPPGSTDASLRDESYC